MTIPGQWAEIKEIVGAALERDPTDRTSFLNSACANNEQLRAEVDSLIAAYERAQDLSSPDLQAEWEGSFGENQEVPRTIGPYRLLRLLGAGGMGQVWLAEQTEPLHRLVAIKLTRDFLYHREFRTRFLAERQSLASMNHPSIAKIFEAGETPSGQLYFVMEYVDGCPLTEYCDRQRLSIAERLRLLVQVCDGVQHAHLKAVIHRDLKPSNILVEEVDGQPKPRIIDFGVAKTLAAELDGDRTQTRMGSVIGTLGYMSPEQASAGREDIDTRTDGYSLGVLLYELLTGKLPHPYEDLGWYEAVRQLCEQEPPRPSQRLRDAADAHEISYCRHSAHHDLVGELRGDLDSIALKSIAMDRDRRYETTSALAADIERYLRDEPVTAHAGSLRYRARKYVRRHRGGVFAAIAATFLLLGFAAAQSRQLRNTRLQRDRADRIAEFMTSMFRTPEPSESRGSAITARQILDQSAYRVETGHDLDKTTRQQLMQVMAKTYLGLGIYGRAVTLARQVYEERQRTLGANDRSTLDSMTLLAEIADRQGQEAEARRLIEQAIERETRVLGAEDALTLKSREDLTLHLLGHAHYIEAEKSAGQIVSIETRKFGGSAPSTFASTNLLARALRGQSRFAEVEKLFKQLLADERQTLGPDHPLVLETMHNLANMLAEQGRYAEAEGLYRETIAMERRVLGPAHPDTADSITTLANTVTRDPHRKAEAEALYRQALVIEQQAVGPDHPYTTRAEEGLANNLGGQNRLEEAEPLLQQVLASRRRTLNPDDTDTLLTSYNLACILLKQKRYPEAEQLMRTTLDQQTRVLDANDPDTLASGTLLASILLQEGRPQEAETFASKAYAAQLRLLGPDHSDTRDSRQTLALALARQARYSEGQALYTQWIAKREHGPKADLADAWYAFACLAALTGHTNDAFTYLHTAMQFGYNDVAGLREDNELDGLHNDPRFARLVDAFERSLSKQGDDAHRAPHS